MTDRQRNNLILSLQAHLVEIGYTEDRFGNFKKTDEDGRQRRVKIGTISVRFEYYLAYKIPSMHRASKGAWRNMTPGKVHYIKDYTRTKDGRMNFQPGV